MSAPNGPHLLHLHAAAEEHGRAHRAHHERNRDQAAEAYEQAQAAAAEQGDNRDRDFTNRTNGES